MLQLGGCLQLPACLSDMGFATLAMAHVTFDQSKHCLSDLVGGNIASINYGERSRAPLGIMFQESKSVLCSYS